MLQFARRSRWLLWLMLLLTAVTVFMYTPVGGSETEELRSAHTQVAEPEDEDAENEQAALSEEVIEAEEEEPLGARWKKHMRRYYDRKRALLTPLILLGVVAVYAAAGLMVYQLRKPVGAKWSEFWRGRGRGQVGEESALTTLVKTGKRVIPAAVALGIAVGAATLIHNKYDFSKSFGGSFPWGGGFAADRHE